MIKTVLHGAGRMARGVFAELQAHPQFQLVAVVSRSEPAGLSHNDQTGTTPANTPGSNADWSNTKWFESLDHIDTEVDLLIDFTLPGGPATAACWCRQNEVALLSGTTGLTDIDEAALKSAAADVAVLWASNMSQGIALISALARQAATSIGAVADITISDIHHQHKQDAPSGTALTLAEAVMSAQEQGVEESVKAGEIAFISVRKGEVIGEHTISFELDGEIVEISHKAHDRNVFAKGALSAGAWLSKQTPGYYKISDWLNIG